MYDDIEIYFAGDNFAPMEKHYRAYPILDLKHVLTLRKHENDTSGVHNVSATVKAI